MKGNFKMWFDSERISHAYITTDSFATTAATAVVCSERTGTRPCKKCIHCDKASRNIHPDIIVINKELIKNIDKEANKEKVNIFVNVDVIRWIKRNVYIMPNESDQKVYIVEDADSMNINAQNAFLKMLEEPPKHTVFILCAENPAALLPTIRSRCVELKRQPANTSKRTDTETVQTSDIDEINDELISEFILALNNDNIKLMQCMFRLEKLEKNSFSGFLVKSREHIIKTLRENQKTQSHELNIKLVHAEKIILQSMDMLDMNVSPGHISGFICANML